MIKLSTLIHRGKDMLKIYIIIRQPNNIFNNSKINKVQTGLILSLKENFQHQTDCSMYLAYIYMETVDAVKAFCQIYFIIT